MEPLFFKAENRFLFGWRYLGFSGFNGAAFFQSGKQLSAWQWIRSRQSASMEPLFFKAEN